MTRLRRSPITTMYGPAATVAAAALLLWAVVVQRHAGAAAGSIEGTYTVRVAGYGNGGGSVTVGDKRVDIVCQITDDAGNQQQLRASNLTLDQNRFSGMGALDGVRVTVSGRIDPADANATKPRVVATFLAVDQRVGRIVGSHD